MVRGVLYGRRQGGAAGVEPRVYVCFFDGRKFRLQNHGDYYVSNPYIHVDHSGDGGSRSLIVCQDCDQLCFPKEKSA